MIRALIACVVLVAACKEGETTDETIEAKGSTKTGSAGGFAASLEADLAAGSGSGGSAAPTPPAGSNAGSAAGSNAGGAAGSGAGSAAGSGAGSATPSAGSGAGSGAGSAAASAGSGAGSAMAAGSGAGSAAKPGAGSATPSAGSGAGSATKPGAGSAVAATGSNAGSAASTPAAGSAAPPKVVVVPAELRAIKLSMLPNWDRDLDEAGTISLTVKVQRANGPETAVFKFHYGYDVAGAPTDREAYKKFLADKKLFTSLADRQMGAAWYLEGTDATGPAFRFLVSYGGKRLVCYGSLYKNSGLGDIRDEVIIQAKKICESLAL